MGDSGTPAVEGVDRFHGAGHLRELELEGMEQGGERGRMDSASWIGRLAGSRDRRGSVGFSEPGMNLNSTLARMDEDDSNSGLDVAMWDDRSGISIDRKKWFSLSDAQTPVADGEYFPQHFRVRQVEDPLSPGQEYSLIKDGRFEVELKHKRSVRNMDPLMEGIVFGSLEFGSLASVVHQSTDQSIPGMQLGVLRGMEVNPPQQDQGTAHPTGGGGRGSALARRKVGTVLDPKQAAAMAQGERPSIFLIDLETSEDDGTVRIKAQSQKFSLSRLLQANWAQSWFFRNNENEDQAEEESAQLGEEQRRTEGLAEYLNTEEGAEPLSILGKFNRAVRSLRSHPEQMREMNTWQPQGT